MSQRSLTSSPPRLGKLLANCRQTTEVQLITNLLHHSTVHASDKQTAHLYYCLAERTPSAGTDAYRRSAFSVSGAGGQQPDESDALLRDAEGGEASSSPEAQALEQELDVKRQPGLWPRIKRLFGGQNFDRKRLAALGEL